MMTIAEIAAERYLDALQVIAQSDALTDEEMRLAKTLPEMVRVLCVKLEVARKPCGNCGRAPIDEELTL